jgi:hypothetical protein
LNPKEELVNSTTDISLMRKKETTLFIDEAKEFRMAVKILGIYIK